MADIKIVTEIKSGRSLSETEAGQELDSQLTALQAQHDKQMAELRNEYKQARKAQDKEQQEEIKKMREELQGRIDKVEKDKAELATAKVSYAAQAAEIGRHIPFVPGPIGALVGGAVGGIADHRAATKDTKLAKDRPEDKTLAKDHPQSDSSCKLERDHTSIIA
jgi:TolA-binding protein